MMHDSVRRRPPFGGWKGWWGKSQVDKEKLPYRERESIDGFCKPCDRVTRHEITRTPVGKTTTCTSCGVQDEERWE